MDTAPSSAPCSSPAPEPLQGEGGRIEGWPAWAEHVRAALSEAADRGAPLFLQDDDFARWPLGEKACVDSFDRWVLAPGRAQATLVALRWDAVLRQHPRWLRWRTPWGHRVRCLSCPESELSSLEGFAPTLLIQGVLLMQMHDLERGLGHWSRDTSAVRTAWLRCDAISQRSLDSGISATLGL